jgi:hypothetical protein
MNITSSFTFFGFDFLADIDFVIESFPISARTYGPPEFCYTAEPAEYYIDSIYIYPDDGREHPGFEATGAFFDSLSKYFDANIQSAIDNYEPDELY